ncbi:MAG: sigma-E factor negative regulatory protein [Steroidobacteraceae bacterium]|jgi:anti-sigma factor RsiW|nr:hypothetical protein [Gammaproteobacteria bacterium]NBR16393.1 hypothetical protein [Gammaproteobacteria bacterium]NCW21858.1 hypothetical protein [Gammaproteobacteria bacterium]NDA42621.1 hypothetical protein [Gammaproteobacteria bacterium]NDB16979.1 hypothetical protein [Gammaproteobacteria bacterium]
MNGNTSQGAAGSDGNAELLEQRESQLSAMFDGELPEAECELLARRLARDENLRRSWENYALIGSVLRSETVAGNRLAARVAAEIAEGDRAQRERAPRMPRWAVPASGLGLAAAIAVVGVFGLFWFRAAPPETVATGSMLPKVQKSKVEEVIIPAMPSEPLLAKAPVEAASSAEPKGNGEPMSYVTPPLNTGAVNPAFPLAGYVGAHTAVSAPMLRHSSMSAVIAVDAPTAEVPAEEVR